MRRFITVLAVTLVFVLAGCKAKEEVAAVDTAPATVQTETTVTTMSVTDTGIISDVATTDTAMTATPTATVTQTVVTATTATVAPAKPAAKPAAAAPKATPAPATATRAPAATTPAPQPAPVVQPAPTPAPAPAPAASPAPAKTEPAPAAKTPSAKLPKTHTVSRDGSMHAPNAEQASTKCVACHGKDLRGGRVGVSCFDCHEKVWK